MRIHSVSALVILGLAAATAAFAYSVRPKEPPTPAAPAPGAALTTRQQAERWYAEAYEEIAKGKQERAQGREKGAAKRFKRGLERGEKATALDTTYHEAFNLVGYCARQLKQYDRSLAAYRKSLALEPDYAPAREYLGELYVDLGRLDEAREQLAWLEEHEGGEGARTLAARIAEKSGAPGGTLTAPAPAAAADTLRTPPPGADR